MSCGRFLGEIEGAPGMKAVDARVEHPQGRDMVTRERDGLHCAVCGGRAIVQDLRKVAAAA
jgi:hypothetical protein